MVNRWDTLCPHCTIHLYELLAAPGGKTSGWRTPRRPVVIGLQCPSCYRKFAPPNAWLPGSMTSDPRSGVGAPGSNPGVEGLRGGRTETY